MRHLHDTMSCSHHSGEIGVSLVYDDELKKFIVEVDEEHLDRHGYSSCHYEYIWVGDGWPELSFRGWDCSAKYGRVLCPAEEKGCWKAFDPTEGEDVDSEDDFMDTVDDD